jgi:hypothetical protein
VAVAVEAEAQQSDMLAAMVATTAAAVAAAVTAQMRFIAQGLAELEPQDMGW